MQFFFSVKIKSFVSNFFEKQPKLVKLSYFPLEKSFFFSCITNFFPLISKLATVARGHPKTIRTQSLIGKLGFGGFSKKIRDKTFYFYTKKKILHYYFILSFGPRVHFRGQKLTFFLQREI
jgi:hypothetical protein